MTIEISYREHDTGGLNPPTVTWSKPDGTTFRGYSFPDASMGAFYMFFVVPRAWIHGKYLRWRWEAWYSWTFTTSVQIWDGEFVRSSMVDFPDGAGPITKGNGILQTLDANSGTFAAETVDVQIDTSGGSEVNVTIIIRCSDSWSQQNGYFQLDWIEVNGGAGGANPLYNEQFTGAIVPEQTGTYNDYGYIGRGGVPALTKDLACSFYIKDFADLKAVFNVRQAGEDLLAGFLIRQEVANLLAHVNVVNESSADFPALFAVRRTATPLELPALFHTGGRGNIPAKFRVTKYYDLDGTAGIAFYWWGAENPPEAMNQLILTTPTGFWYTTFFDGLALWRLVKIPWGSFIWVSSPQRLLEPHRHGFNPPDKSQIDGFIWTVHTHGLRRLDYVYAFPRGPAILRCYFAIRRTASPLTLPAKFLPRHAASQNLAAKFHVVIPASEALPASFRIGQDIENLLAGFISKNVGFQDLLGGFWAAAGEEFEDFEDATLEDHYQHYAGTGFRNNIFAHTGAWSWRTPRDSNDTFDLSGGQILAFVRIEAWARYGNGTLKFELLDNDLNIVKTVTWSKTSTYVLKTIEYTGPVRYLKITCPAGSNSGLWTDDITITWTTQAPTSRNLACGFTVNHP